ncbi:hypothetical protein MAHJHV57_52010 [Mycobacterium avium subsp. hominissuis]
MPRTAVVSGVLDLPALTALVADSRMVICGDERGQRRQVEDSGHHGGARQPGGACDGVREVEFAR